MTGEGLMASVTAFTTKAIQMTISRMNCLIYRRLSCTQDDALPHCIAGTFALPTNPSAPVRGLAQQPANIFRLDCP